MRSLWILVLAFSFFYAGPLGCDGLLENCDRSGCEALNSPAQAGNIGQGLAGVAASESDAITNGCQTCGFSQGTVEIWSSSTPVTTAQEAFALLETAQAPITIEIDETYQEELDLGHYLACVTSVGEVCAAVSVEAGAVTTVSVKYVYGPASLVVFDPASTSPRQEGIFEL